MKTKNIATLTFGLLLSLSLNAQCINGTKSYPIYKEGAELVEKYDEAGLEIVRIEYDLIFSSKETTRNLSSDWEYTILGFADQGVKDLDVKVYEYDELIDKWKLVIEDDSDERYAALSVKPSKSARFKVELIVDEFQEGYTAARYGLIYSHE